MICPKCQADNRRHSNYCHHCGASFSSVHSQGFGVIFLIICAMIAAGGVYLLYQRFHLQVPDGGVSNGHRSTSSLPATRKPAGFFRQGVAAGAFPDAKIEIPVAEVNLLDISGKITRSIPVAVTANGWLALPVRLCLGAYSWKLNLGKGWIVDIEGGILEDFDDIGVWNLREAIATDGPEIAPWTDDTPLAWMSIVSDKSVPSIFPTGIAQQANVAKFFHPSLGDEPGVFVQDNRIVGWTFGIVAGQGYLWQGPEGNQLVTNIRADDFYRLTFADGREEQLILAYAVRDVAVREKMAAFVAAFNLEPRLAKAETPPELQSETAIVELRRLIAKLAHEGSGKVVADSFDTRALTAAGSVPLLIDVARAVRNTYGYADALALVEDVRNVLADLPGTLQAQLNLFHAELYEKRLDLLLQRGDVITAQQVFELGSGRFPDNPRIHLTGVQLAVENQDWSTAETLLYMQEYPPELIDQVRNLQNRISEMKAIEGKVIIRFTPESRQIPVNALLNDTVSQRFIVDTGATIVTIPPSTARELGIDLNRPGPLRTAYTAGGAVRAREVVLKSVTLDGSVVSDVQALVLNLPDQPGVGLLGLNYLNRFRMDLDSAQGTLTLEPR